MTTSILKFCWLRPRNAYTLTDRATWVNFNNRQDLDDMTSLHLRGKGRFAAPAHGSSWPILLQKSKIAGDNFPAKGRRDRRPSICVLSIALPRTPSRLQPREFLISSPKRLLQQYRPDPEGRPPARRVRLLR
jgi:hypothetical protein